MNVSGIPGLSQTVLRCDRSTRWTPDGKIIRQEDIDDLAKRKTVLCCVQCRHPITEPGARMELAGGHLHVFTNPGGFTYEVALFEYADCVLHGPATTEYTWFPGYAWQLALCSNCHVHLGWRYSQVGSAAFYGLIRNRLIEGDV
jgi:hypothetical protein